MSNLFDDMLGDNPTEQPEKKKETIVDLPKKEKPKKLKSLTEDMIDKVMMGGETIDEEINRPFWEFPKIEYPYNHFTPGFLMILGVKGGGKTTLGFSVPGNILGITFEKRGNITRPWTTTFSNSPRFQLFGLSEYINRISGEKYKITSNIVYLKACELLVRASKLKEKFDWVMIDGLQATQKTSTQRMKSLNNVGAFDNLPTKLLTKWGERTLYLENLVIDLASSVCKKGVIITSQDEVHKAMFLTKEQEKSGMKIEDIPSIQPSWKDKVKDDVDTVIYTSIAETVLGAGRSKITRYATVSNNKLGGGEGKHNIDLKVDNQVTKKLIETLLTSPMEHEPIE